METINPGSEIPLAYSLQRGTYRRPKKIDLWEMDQATENRPYYATVAALEMCGIAPSRVSIVERVEQLRKTVADLPKGEDEAAVRRLINAEVEAEIDEIELDSSIYQLVRHDVMLANMFYHELGAQTGKVNALTAKTEPFNHLPCLQEVLAMEKKGLIGGFTRRVAGDTLRIMIARENQLLSEEEQKIYGRLVSRHVK